MPEVRPGPDPYVSYKMHHVDRAKAAWAFRRISASTEALRDGPLTVAAPAGSRATIARISGTLDEAGRGYRQARAGGHAP